MEFGLTSPFFGAVCWPLQTGHRDAGEALDGTLSPHTHPPPRPAPGLPKDPQPPHPSPKARLGPVGSLVLLACQPAWSMGAVGCGGCTFPLPLSGGFRGGEMVR